MKKRLTKAKNPLLFGVIGGIAEYFDINLTWARLIAAAIIVFTGFFPGLILYLLAIWIMPDAPNLHRPDAMDGNFTKKQF